MVLNTTEKRNEMKRFCIAENILCEVLISVVFWSKIYWKFEKYIVKYITDFWKYHETLSQETKRFQKDGKDYFAKVLSVL